MNKGNILTLELRLVAILAVAILGGLFSATAHAGILEREIKFKRGSTSTTVKNSVVRGDQHRYGFSANAGQTLSVSIRSAENNAAFRLYVVGAYGYHGCRNEGGDVPFDCAAAVDRGQGPRPRASGLDAERQTFTDSLPYGSKNGKGGTYAIVVEPTHGSATYTLSVTIQ